MDSEERPQSRSRKIKFALEQKGSSKAKYRNLTASVTDDGSDDSSDLESKLDARNPLELETRAVSFMQGIKEKLVKATVEKRNSGKIPNPMMLSKTALAEAVAKEFLIAALIPNYNQLTASPQDDIAALGVTFAVFKE